MMKMMKRLMNHGALMMLLIMERLVIGITVTATVENQVKPVLFH